MGFVKSQALAGANCLMSGVREVFDLDPEAFAHGSPAHGGATTSAPGPNEV